MTKDIAIDPFPTAEATRFTFPGRTSLTAYRPGEERVPEVSHTLRVTSDSFGVFLLPFVSKFVELVEGHTDFLHALGQAISHCRQNRRLVVAKDNVWLAGTGGYRCSCDVGSTRSKRIAPNGGPRYRETTLRAPHDDPRNVSER